MPILQQHHTFVFYCHRCDWQLWYWILLYKHTTPAWCWNFDPWTPYWQGHDHPSKCWKLFYHWNVLCRLHKNGIQQLNLTLQKCWTVAWLPSHTGFLSMQTLYLLFPHFSFSLQPASTSLPICCTLTLLVGRNYSTQTKLESTFINC